MRTWKRLSGANSLKYQLQRIGLEFVGTTNRRYFYTIAMDLSESLIKIDHDRRFQIDEVLYCEYKCLEQGNELKYKSVTSNYWTPRNYFVYVLSGQKKWSTQKEDYLLHPGQLIFIKKGAFASHTFYDDEPFLAIIISMPDSFIRDASLKYFHNHRPQANPQPSDTIIPVTTSPQLTAYFDSVKSHFITSKTPPEVLLNLKLQELIYNILGSAGNSMLVSYFYDIAQSITTSIPEVMESNFLFNFEIPEFARMCGRSLSSFKREFYQVYKTSPGKWLTERRLAHAKRLVDTTNHDINTVAIKSGFENTSHFIRVFRQQYGTSPGKLRAGVLVNV